MALAESSRALLQTLGVGDHPSSLDACRILAEALLRLGEPDRAGQVLALALSGRGPGRRVTAIPSGETAAAEEPAAESWESQELLDRIATEVLTRAGLEVELRTMEERPKRVEQLLDHQGRDRRP